jgi:hypothetical protein
MELLMIGVAVLVGFVMGFVFRPFIAASFGWKQ